MLRIKSVSHIFRRSLHSLNPLTPEDALVCLALRNPSVSRLIPVMNELIAQNYSLGQSSFINYVDLECLFWETHQNSYYASPFPSNLSRQSFIQGNVRYLFFSSTSTCLFTMLNFLARRMAKVGWNKVHIEHVVYKRRLEEVWFCWLWNKIFLI